MFYIELNNHIVIADQHTKKPAYQKTSSNFSAQCIAIAAELRHKDRTTINK